MVVEVAVPTVEMKLDHPLKVQVMDLEVVPHTIQVHKLLVVVEHMEIMEERDMVDWESLDLMLEVAAVALVVLV